MLVVAAAFLLLAVSCSEGGSYVVSTTAVNKVVSVLDQWAGQHGYAGTGCARYYRDGIEGTCYRLVEPGGATTSFLAAEELEPNQSIRVWITFTGVAEAQRTATLRSLGSALLLEFGAGSVRPED